jgi:hypothetical protein
MSYSTVTVLSNMSVIDSGRFVPKIESSAASLRPSRTFCSRARLQHCGGPGKLGKCVTLRGVGWGGVCVPVGVRNRLIKKKKSQIEVRVKNDTYKRFLRLVYVQHKRRSVSSNQTKYRERVCVSAERRDETDSLEKVFVQNRMVKEKRRRSS